MRVQSPQLPAVEAALAALPRVCACGEGSFLARRMATQTWPLCVQLLRYGPAVLGGFVESHDMLRRSRHAHACVCRQSKGTACLRLQL